MNELQAIGFFLMVVGLLMLLVAICIDIGYKQATEDSLKNDPPSRWRKALIDAEAERAKEAIR